MCKPNIYSYDVIVVTNGYVISQIDYSAFVPDDRIFNHSEKSFSHIFEYLNIIKKTKDKILLIIDDCCNLKYMMSKYPSLEKLITYQSDNYSIIISSNISSHEIKEEEDQDQNLENNDREVSKHHSHSKKHHKKNKMLYDDDNSDAEDHNQDHDDTHTEE